ncbi:MAG: LamG domain-containing protein, partial [Gammaproteobacteria bacterium]|nr:LamG domain-containing protein [Gammaproteobacteria bacterium]
MPFEANDGNETSFTKDYSDSGYNGTVIGATWNATGGHDGKGAYEFDGVNDYIDLGSPAEFPYGNSSRSLCVRTKADSTSSGYHFAAAYGTPGIGTAFLIGRNGSKLVVGGYGDDITVSNFWVPDVWNYMCLTYDGTTAKVYSNGNLLSSANKNWSVTQDLAYIGRQINNFGEYWDGAVSDVQIFNIALSAEQIANLSNGNENIIVAEETTPDETWQSCVTPNDGTEDGE